LSRTDERDAFGRRRLTELERGAILDAPLAGIWSTLDAAGRIHSVPVLTPERWIAWSDSD
jgi:hypothetical protein